MYAPDMFAVTDPGQVEAVLANLRLGCLVTRDAEGFFGTHLPMLYDPARRVLSGHIARPNPHPARSGDGEAMAIFQGIDAYVSPNWYPSKAEHGKVVPTWNYEVAHVSGRLTWHDDEAWLRAQLAALTDRHERDSAAPWALGDAPDSYVTAMIKGVVGVELAVRDVLVKRKMSQNRSLEDRQGVVAGLSASGDTRDRQVADAVRSFGD
jgi:transcriptional regulator